MNRLYLALAALCALTLNAAHADGIPQAPLPSGAELAAQIHTMDEAAIRDVGLKQAEQIRQLPTQLRAQGIPVTAEQEARFSLAADRLAKNASQSGFKNRVEGAVKKTTHLLKRIGIDTLKGVGYVGTSAFSASMAPLLFGFDLTTGLILGHGVITVHSTRNNIEELLGLSGGITAFYYAYVGLAALGYTFEGTLVASSLGVVLTNHLLCTVKAQDGGVRELDRYCDETHRIEQAILKESSCDGTFIGDHIHRDIVNTAKLVASPFRHGAQSALNGLVEKSLILEVTDNTGAKGTIAFGEDCLEIDSPITVTLEGIDDPREAKEIELALGTRTTDRFQQALSDPKARSEEHAHLFDSLTKETKTLVVLKSKKFRLAPNQKILTLPEGFKRGDELKLDLQVKKNDSGSEFSAAGAPVDLLDPAYTRQ